MIKNFADELKEHRVRSNITLQQIHSKTRIDMKFLEAIESGNFDVLPEVYLRAFLKDYAKSIGYDEALAIKKYEAAKAGKSLEEHTAEIPEPEKTTPPKNYHAEESYSPVDSDDQGYSRFPKSNAFWGLVAVAFLILVVVLYIMFFQGPSEIVTEKPYDEIISQQNQDDEETNIAEESVQQDTSVISNTIFSDSLQLTIRAKETTWILSKVDNQSAAEDFILKPNTQKMLKAARNFSITIGNSGGVSLLLNNNPLSFSGRSQEVRTINIDSTGIKTQ